MHFMIEKFGILNQISLKFDPKGPIDNGWVLVQVMAWRRTGDRPLSGPMVTQFTDAYMRHKGEMTFKHHSEIILSRQNKSISISM